MHKNLFRKMDFDLEHGKETFWSTLPCSHPNSKWFVHYEYLRIYISSLSTFLHNLEPQILNLVSNQNPCNSKMSPYPTPKFSKLSNK
jgi:hypothetical protein